MCEVHLRVLAGMLAASLPALLASRGLTNPSVTQTRCLHPSVHSSIHSSRKLPIALQTRLPVVCQLCTPSDQKPRRPVVSQPHRAHYNILNISRKRDKFNRCLHDISRSLLHLPMASRSAERIGRRSTLTIEGASEVGHADQPRTPTETPTALLKLHCLLCRH
jgi:hypothetical protein